MCGLGGYIGKPIRNESVLWKLFTELKARGKDGFGYLTYRPDQEPKHRTVVYKDSIPVSDKALTSGPGMLGSTVVLMHTRAATSGTREAVDCHPLVHNKVGVVHNGQVSRHTETRKELGLADENKWPQVDSFLIAYTIGQAKSIREGIEDVFKKFNGSLTFLVFTPKSPLNIWAASNIPHNLYQFRYDGQDYLASNPNYFGDSLVRDAKFNGKYFPAYSMSGYLDGVWEISPHTMKQVISIEDIGKMAPVEPPTVVHGWGGKGYSPKVRTENGNLVLPKQGTKGGLYLLAGKKKGSVGGTEGAGTDVPGTEALEAKEPGEELQRIGRGIVAEGLEAHEAKQLIRILNSRRMIIDGKVIMDDPLRTKCILCQGQVAQVTFEDADVCFRCLLIQVGAGKASPVSGLVGEDFVKSLSKDKQEDEKNAVRWALERFGPVD